MTGILRQLGNDWAIAVVASLAVMITVCAETAKPAQTMETQAAAQSIIERVAGHEFHPIRDGFTYDRHLDTHGVADLEDPDWRVRLFAVRDLIRLGPPAGPALITALAHTNGHVRHVVAMTLGILEIQEAAQALELALRQDANEVVRAQAAVSPNWHGARGG
jgi:hypothetical protein